MNIEEIDSNIVVVKNKILFLEDESKDIIHFSKSSLESFVNSLSEFTTVKRLIVNTNVDKMNECMKQIDEYFNSSSNSNKLIRIVNNISSNFAFDVLEEKLLFEG